MSTSISNIWIWIIYTGFPCESSILFIFIPSSESLSNIGHFSNHLYTEILPIDNYQVNAAINYTEKEIPHTRIIEHKHFDPVDLAHTAITEEYSCDWKRGKDAYYPINDKENNEEYQRYQALAEKEKRVLFGGRLAEYKYDDSGKPIMVFEKNFPYLNAIIT